MRYKHLIFDIKYINPYNLFTLYIVYQNNKLVMKYFRGIWLVMLVFCVGVSCQDDFDDLIVPTGNSEIQDFVWKAMNIFYLYKSDVPDLADNRFTSDADYTEFLNSFASPENLFENLLRNDDRFSIIVSDYRVLESALQGITLSNGMRFGLVRIQDTNQVFGYVRYVVPESPASVQEVKRGMVFTQIDGVNLTDTNFNDLLSPEQYTIGLATLDNNQLVSTGESITLDKIELTENPVHVARTLNVNGQTIAYLMYNAFRSNFETELNQAFGDFLVNGATDLVLDLRYNGGGSIETAKDLASMVTGQFEGELFAREKYNDNFENEGLFFDGQISNGEDINSLNLDRVFILTSGSSASASELVINSLEPYINVVQIGTNTVGKFQGSTTLYDSPDFRRQGANPGHFYALQPLILEIENADGFTGFTDGLIPDFEQQEDFFNLGVLGEPSEPLLARALQEIGVGLQDGASPVSSEKSLNFQFKTLGESGMQSPNYQRMYSDL